MVSLRYQGCAQFRQRIVLSALSGKKLRIDKIREDDENPGMTDFEANFLRLVEKLTDGISIEINETGTSLKFRPGLVVGGHVSHDCGNVRSIGWFLEGIIPLLLFSKESVFLQLTGITNDALDLSVDILKNVTLPFLRNFGIEGMDLKVKRRGAAPLGGGIIEFSCPTIRELKPINLVDMGLIKRVRGIAYCSRISPTILTRVVDSTRNVLNNLLPDVYIHTDHYNGVDGGASPGYSLSLVAESNTGVLLSIERTAIQGELPEDIGREGAVHLLEEIRRGGVIDRAHQSLALQLMILGPEDVLDILNRSQRSLRSVAASPTVPEVTSSSAFASATSSLIPAVDIEIQEKFAKVLQENLNRNSRRKLPAVTNNNNTNNNNNNISSIASSLIQVVPRQPTPSNKRRGTVNGFNDAAPTPTGRGSGGPPPNIR
eukprot:gene1907-3688_t